MKLGDILRQNREYNIVGHTRPDGDCVGSQLAIYTVLKNMGIKCNVVKNDEYDRAIADFFGTIEFVKVEDCDASLPLICVDCSDIRRIGTSLIEKYANSAPYLNVDHHFSNENFANYNFVDCEAASTTQLITETLLKENIAFDKKTAEFLYLGIMTDTANFARANTTLRTIQAVEILMRKGISTSEIHSKVYERDSVQKYRLLCRLSNNIEIFADGLCCISHINDKDFEETGALATDSKEFVDYTRKIDGVVVGAFIEFHKNYTKCSLRASTPTFRVDLFAKEFNGGGHQAAAGFTIEPVDDNFYENLKISLAEHTKKFYKQTVCH